MTVTKTPTGRWRAQVKNGRAIVASKTFDLKRDADTCHDNQKRLLTLGEFVDPKAGRESLGDAIERWMESRKGTVAGSTLTEEGYAVRKLPAALRHRPVSAIRVAALEAFYGVMLRTRARSTVARLRNTLSSFYGWAVREGLVATNPVVASRVPKGTGTEQRHEVYPFNIDELRAVHAVLATKDQATADIILVLGLTGLRWGELAAMRVRDVQLIPFPAFRVSRSRPDGQAVRSVTKGGKPRTVPLVEDLVPIIEAATKGRQADDILFPDAKGGMRLGSNFKRSIDWDKTGKGRRIHDLRHTAATLWLSNKVDLKTAQAWLGHSSAKLTADTYSHWLGSDADSAAIARMNSVLGSAGGARPTNLRATNQL